MELAILIDQYINYRKSLGEKFRTNGIYLRAFCKAIGPSIDICDINEDIVNQYLYYNAEIITSGWFIKHTALLGFFQYALSRGYITNIPLPKMLPKQPQAFVPYIYSKEELNRLFDAALHYQKNRSHIEPHMVRVILILTYALGLRPHEIISLHLENIDLNESVLTIQNSKFYKSRLVPFSNEVKQFIENYLQWRINRNQPQTPDANLFIDNKGNPCNFGTIQKTFPRIREKADIKRTDNATFEPRWHDLRHTFAVNRLIGWYQEHKDVQHLLPILSTYMGHTHLAHTSVYLTMTDKLLQEANMKFEQYIFTGEQP